MINVELGSRWRTNPSHRAWKVERLGIVKNNQPAVLLVRGGVTKEIQIRSMITTYMLVGSEKEAVSIAAWKRHNWPLAEDVT